MTRRRRGDRVAGLLDIPAFADHLRVPATRVRKWVQRYGITPAGRDGRRNLYRLEDLYGAERRARENITR